MFYRMHVAGLERDLPICPVNENLYIAGFVIFGDQELTVACARDLLARAPEYDYILTAEAKGIPLAHEMARQHGDAKYILARKGSQAVYAGHFLCHRQLHHHRQGAEAVPGRCGCRTDEGQEDLDRG